MGTYQPKASEIEREWLVIDAADQILGRVATHAAHLLRGTNLGSSHGQWRQYYYHQCRQT